MSSAQWQSADLEERAQLAEEIAECGTVHGWSRRDAVDWLGQPDHTEGGDLYWRLDSDYLEEPRYMALDIEAGKVERITVP